MIRVSLPVPLGLDKGSESVKPCSGRLFQTIYRFLEFTHMLTKLSLKSRRRAHVDFLYEVSIQKGILNIQLI